MTVFNLIIQFRTVRFQTKKELGLFIFYDLTIKVYSSISRPYIIKFFLVSNLLMSLFQKPDYSDF